MCSLSRRFHRPKLIPLVMFLGAFGLTLALGTWQVERLQWKEGLIAQIAESNRSAPIATLPIDEAALAALQFHTAALSGHWLGDTEFHLSPRYFKGTLGYHIIAPLKLADGRIVLVNRGWVPSEKKLLETRPETRVHGKTHIAGLIRVGNERNYFTPINQPSRNVWFGRDVAEMAEFAKLEHVVLLMVDATGKQDINHLPVPSDGTIRLRNDHLSYVITWYSIALGILVIFLVYHRKK